FYSSPSNHHPHSFPTRRSSDLANPVLQDPCSPGQELDSVPLLHAIAVEVAMAPDTPDSTRNTYAPCPHCGKVNRVRLGAPDAVRDRKSTRLNSSHDQISYAVFC